MMGTGRSTAHQSVDCVCFGLHQINATLVHHVNNKTRLESSWLFPTNIFSSFAKFFLIFINWIGGCPVTGAVCCGGVGGCLGHTRVAPTLCCFNIDLPGCLPKGSPRGVVAPWLGGLCGAEPGPSLWVWCVPLTRVPVRGGGARLALCGVAKQVRGFPH